MGHMSLRILSCCLALHAIAAADASAQVHNFFNSHSYQQQRELQQRETPRERYERLQQEYKQQQSQKNKNSVSVKTPESSAPLDEAAQAPATMSKDEIEALVNQKVEEKVKERIRIVQNAPTETETQDYEEDEFTDSSNGGGGIGGIGGIGKIGGIGSNAMLDELPDPSAQAMGEGAIGNPAYDNTGSSNADDDLEDENGIPKPDAAQRIREQSR